jgi:hypothetical protein
MDHASAHNSSRSEHRKYRPSGFRLDGLDADQLAELIGQRGEYVLNWTTSQGHPVGVVIAYLYRSDRFWMNCTTHRKRVAALTARPQCSVVLNNDGRSATMEQTGRMPD